MRARADQQWTERIKRLLKAELSRRGITYRELSARLDAIGVHETEDNINKKIARGSFTAVFFFQCMEAIGCQTLRLHDD